ncbi:hypothetical protein F5876DRAFT_65301 [Lentinula aff. lateritia]|uniref:Uncharacterized protein n=1 Tax=Lentinula aff. lateritia TaxID=2804960 RepID=A0ACC1U1Y5_9AGAR|nr:hypothetical protein F5876DRAFT_65301 [Lentinula aff. lateritia]
MFRVTLWEFGAGRLDSGQSTAPLQPIGTPADGLSTTYLYRVMTSISSTLESNDDGSPVFTTSVSTATRTIVASASGWIEKFGTTNTIQCNFLNSEGDLKSHCLPYKHLFLYHTNGSSKIINDPGNNHWRDNCRIICFIRQRRSLPVSNTKNVDGLLEPFPYTANATVTRGIFHPYPQQCNPPIEEMLHSSEVSKGCTRMALFLAAAGTLGHFEHGYDSRHREVAAVAAPSSEVEVNKVLNSKRLMREEEKLLPRGRKGMMMISGGF